MHNRPYRSVLYSPASNERALDKARTMAVDGIIFDLEDAVAAAEKAAARAMLVATLQADGYGGRAKIVRVNGLDTEWGRADIEALSAAAPAALLLPKVNTAQDIQAALDVMARFDGYQNTKLWAMMETPLGILNALSIAQAPRMEGLVMGTNDLAKDINARPHADRLPMQAALGTCVLAAKAAGLVIVDGVYNAFKDEEGLRRECAQGRDMGFDGKTLIHPAQVAIANDAFAPGEAEVALAKRQIAAFEAATAKGQGVAVVDGKIVENLHIDMARATLAKQAAIEALEAPS